MSGLFVAAFPFNDDVLSLPVTNLDEAVAWYSTHFGLHEVSREAQPVPRVIMARDDARVGFAINGEDATQDGAAILVSDIHRAREDLEARGLEVGDSRIDERDGKKLEVFFIVAPDGLCYYFHQPLED
ncbi:MAG: VOC family protein [Proteobacteria bacterium]|jgi:catechol 2,3-dioxygenase-like lactoylglutathione lyase family enzyme|nr:VOC family protein [Pseudomonadota bacterium]MDA1301362.1 VOC family protein [Pseudomonadota bacterium]